MGFLEARSRLLQLDRMSILHYSGQLPLVSRVRYKHAKKDMADIRIAVINLSRLS